MTDLNACPKCGSDDAVPYVGTHGDLNHNPEEPGLECLDCGNIYEEEDEATRRGI